MNGRNNNGRIIFAVVAILVVVVMLFLSVGKARSYASIQTDIAMQKAALEQEQIRLEQLEKLSKQDKELTASIEASKKLVPSKPQEDELIKYFQSKADEAGTNFIQIRFDARVTGPQYIQMPIKITFTGDYLSLMNFLKQIYDGERAIRVDSVAVKAGTTTKSDVTAELSATAFYTNGSAVAAINAVTGNNGAGTTGATTTATASN